MSVVTQKGTTEMTIFQKLSQYANYRKAVRELAELDSRQLKDIGLTRGDIKAAARGLI